MLKLRNARYAHQFLDPPVGSDRNHQPPTDLELGLRRLRHFGAAGRDDDRVVRRVILPAARAVCMQHMHIPVAELGQHRRRLLVELADAFDGVNLFGNLRQDSRRVTRAGADFEHLFAPVERQRLRHQRDDIGLRDRLSLGYRQRCVLIGEFAKVLRQEDLPRDGLHRFKHQLRAYTTARDVVFNHRVASLRKIDLVHLSCPRAGGRMG